MRLEMDRELEMSSDLDHNEQRGEGLRSSSDSEVSSVIIPCGTIIHG